MSENLTYTPRPMSIPDETFRAMLRGQTLEGEPTTLIVPATGEHADAMGAGVSELSRACGIAATAG